MMLVLAWRNLARNRRRTLLTGVAVATAVILPAWLVGLTYGAYDQMIGQAVESRIGHLQVTARGYLERPEPRLVVPEAESLVRSLAALPGVAAVSARAVGEGLLSRDGETVPVELVGVEPEAEARASVVPDRVFRGPRAVRWCHERMARARRVLGGDKALFGRWCEAVDRGSFLPADQPRAVAVGRGVAERLLVSVGDEVTVQAVRAEGEDRAGRGPLVQRRLVVTAVLATGSPGVDGRGAYLHRDTLRDLLGTAGPNEVVVVLHSIRDLPAVRVGVEAVAARSGALEVHSWDQRNPALSNLIGMAKGSRAIFFSAIAFLIVLSVANATLMSVLERSRELAVMMALGLRRSSLVRMILTEVALLGAVAVAAGGAVAAGLEAVGRTRGFPLAWVGWDPQTLEDMNVSGVAVDSAFYSNIPPAGAVVVVVGVYAAFLLTGLYAALRVRRLNVVDAMRR